MNNKCNNKNNVFKLGNFTKSTITNSRLGYSGATN